MKVKDVDASFRSILIVKLFLSSCIILPETALQGQAVCSGALCNECTNIQTSTPHHDVTQFSSVRTVQFFAVQMGDCTLYTIILLQCESKLLALRVPLASVQTL